MPIKINTKQLKLLGKTLVYRKEGSSYWVYFPQKVGFHKFNKSGFGILLYLAKGMPDPELNKKLKESRKTQIFFDYLLKNDLIDRGKLERLNLVEMDKILIRGAKANEAKLLADLYKDEDQTEYWRVKKEAEKDFCEVKIGRRVAFFAEIDGKTVGAVQLVLDCNHKDHADGKNLTEIHHVKVHNNYLRQKIGTQLVGTVERLAKEKGFKKTTLGVDEDNLVAQKFWEKLGYKLLKVELGRTEEVKLFTLYKNL